MHNSSLQRKHWTDKDNAWESSVWSGHSHEATNLLWLFKKMVREIFWNLWSSWKNGSPLMVNSKVTSIKILTMSEIYKKCLPMWPCLWPKSQSNQSDYNIKFCSIHCQASIMLLLKPYITYCSADDQLHNFRVGLSTSMHVSADQSL